MGAFATAVQSRLCNALANRWPDYDWRTEYRVGETPVDIAGHTAERHVLVELEWRRADPADNTAKLFRHLSEGTVGGRVDVVQVFTGYYDLASGGVSSKRANAEFVGHVATEALDSLTYHPVEFALDPPKRGGERPAEWRSVADDTAQRIVARL